MKLDLLTNATVVDDAIRFMSQKSNDGEKIRSSSSGNSNEDDEESQEKQDEEAREITAPTINQVF